jgi:hypothetical protein
VSFSDQWYYGAKSKVPKPPAETKEGYEKREKGSADFSSQFSIAASNFRCPFET